MTISQIEAMGLTLVIEGVTAAGLAPLFRLDRASCILSAMLASTLTHPILWAVFYPSQALFGTLTTPVLEIFVFLAEAPAYRLLTKCRWDDALLFSLLANAASWAAGELIYALA